MNYKMINIPNERSVKHNSKLTHTNTRKYSPNEMELHFNRKLFVHLFSYLSKKQQHLPMQVIKHLFVS